MATLVQLFSNRGHTTRFLAIREVLLILGTYIVYSSSKNIIDPTPVLRAFSNAWEVVDFERNLGLAHEATIQNWASNYSMGFLGFLAYLYAVGLWIALIGSAALLFSFRREIYWRVRTIFLITMGVALVVFAIYPLAPPRMLPNFGMADVVVLLGLNPVEYSDSPFSYNKYAAMPSLHIAWSILIFVAWIRVGWRWGKLIAGLYLVLMTLAVIATANHYVIDVLAGGLLLIFAFWLMNANSVFRKMVEDRDLRDILPHWPRLVPDGPYAPGLQGAPAMPPVVFGYARDDSFRILA
jgi:hypothetical protein